MSGLGEIPDFILGQPLLEARNNCMVCSVDSVALSYLYQRSAEAAGILHSFRQGAAENRLCTFEGLLEPHGFGKHEQVVCKTLNDLNGNSMMEFACLPSYSESLAPFLIFVPQIV